MTKERHSERTVRCPLEGCDREVLARGVNLHIRQSSDDIHGPQGDVPEGVNLNELETVGEKSVHIDYPQDRKDDTQYTLCPFCHRIFKGKRGIQTHLSQKSGDEQHPDDAAQRYELKTTGQSEKIPTSEEGSVSSRAKRYIEYLLAEGKIEEAKLAKRFLLDRHE
jgi:hypothetical protein